MINMPMTINSDSSAVRSVARRRGVGARLRHLRNEPAAVPESSGFGQVRLDVVQGEKNPGHVLTHALP